MRLDIFLKRVGIFKSRTLAKEACADGFVYLGEKSAKPKDTVKVGDIITITFPHRILKIEVTDIPFKPLKKSDYKKFYKILLDERRREWLEEDFWEKL
jgi:ribosomal 50S subunit-recycling heat shock protein